MIYAAVVTEEQVIRIMNAHTTVINHRRAGTTDNLIIVNMPERLHQKAAAAEKQKRASQAQEIADNRDQPSTSFQPVKGGDLEFNSPL